MIKFKMATRNMKVSHLRKADCLLITVDRVNTGSSGMEVAENVEIVHLGNFYV